MKKLTLIALLIISVCSNAQTEEAKLTTTIKEFHQALVNGNASSINQQTDKVMSYGHSNGWVETKNELTKNLETGFMKYFSYAEDSLKVEINENLAHARFVADIDVARDNKRAVYHLKVLEVWVKKGKKWILFARQAVK
ncbi:MAG TPA: nuclear transport factor 2 family protein [Chitinophagaceae bacterium]|nr:nuclear transport factor 2 family protein [Chitinophagaceae bacterium]